MNTEIMREILETIKDYDRIILFRHFRPDGDSVGSTLGLRDILRETFPQKEVYVINNDYSDYLSFLGPEDPDIADELYADALGIIIDTATIDRISNPKYSLCRELIKIDHHIPVDSYAELEWVEEERSSSCEMIAHFYNTFRNELKITSAAATYIYTGMVTDSGRFRFRSVSGETMRNAGTLLDVGVDLDSLYSNLYMKEFDSFKFQSYVYGQMRMTPNGVIYLHITKAIRERFGLSHEDASASVSYMDSVKNSLIWIAFIDSDDGTTRVRLRSRFVTINELAQKYNGGGHACASGATVSNAKEMRSLIAEADELLGEYKRTHEGWL